LNSEAERPRPKAFLVKSDSELSSDDGGDRQAARQRRHGNKKVQVSGSIEIEDSNKENRDPRSPGSGAGSGLKKSIKVRSGKTSKTNYKSKTAADQLQVEHRDEALATAEEDVEGGSDVGRGADCDDRSPVSARDDDIISDDGQASA
ncbi:hypothetical protein H0H92_000653, partial [Tricholoma furcatifolium]